MTRKSQIEEKADDIIKYGRGMIGHKELVKMAEWCDANPANSEEIKRLREDLLKFKIAGSDGCKSCEPGRVNYYKTTDKCFYCLNGEKR